MFNGWNGTGLHTHKDGKTKVNKGMPLMCSLQSLAINLVDTPHDVYMFTRESLALDTDRYPTWVTRYKNVYLLPVPQHIWEYPAWTRPDDAWTSDTDFFKKGYRLMVRE